MLSLLRKNSNFLLLLFFILSCSKKESSSRGPHPLSEVGVTHGFPSVVSVGGGALCTGAIISPLAILTAHHCIVDPNRLTVRTPYGTTSPVEISTYGTGELGDPHDMAVLIFKEPIASEVIVLSIGESVLQGGEVTLVGFGCNNFEVRSGQGVKRAGTNRVRVVSSFLEIVTPINRRKILGPQNYAGSCFGDSGGPLLQSGNIIGINHSAGEGNEEHLSRYIKINLSENLAFLKQVDQRYQLKMHFVK